ncbi:hypothetical protein ACOBR2_14085 [Telmatobacter bradus]|uniref:hypothetical protein n=1 Tax=Telmatobacter bradus TaxID=474953 RepID=UPI003B4329A8
MVLTVKEAIEAARLHFSELYQHEIDPLAREQIRLEEIKRIPTKRMGGDNWAITFSYPVTSMSSSPFGFNRIAKVVIVDGADGKFVSLKQRAA